jgi:hypothetical protein
VYYSIADDDVRRVIEVIYAIFCESRANEPARRRR